MLVVGTGGIGSGMFLALHGDHTLGREESRAATLLDRRDAAKLHIVLHYVRVLLGTDAAVVPVGMVGDDPPGRDATRRMADVGLDVSAVGVSARPTLFSVCFQYPDGTGGNITTANSAGDDVSPAFVREAWASRVHSGLTGIAVALPEVPLAARAELLRLATDAGFLRVATFVSAEIDDALPLLGTVDLLAVNLDEAAALARVTGSAEATATAAVERATAVNTGLRLVVTAGRHGSWAWDGRDLTHTPAPAVTAVNTAGAGDAHLAGLVVAIARGLPLAVANRYAALVSGRSVISPHTIDTGLTADLIRADARADDVLARFPH
jgi:sugar/nucleoside kinase (ribokinase family)